MDPVLTEKTVSETKTPEQGPSLIQRLNQKNQEKASQETTSQVELPQELVINKEEWLKGVDDPVKRQLLEEKWKLAERGIHEKFGQIAQMRKELERSQGQPKVQEERPWTQERINQLLNDPGFLQVARDMIPANQPMTRQVLEGEEDYSNLSESEKLTLQTAISKAADAERKANQILASQARLLDQQEHDYLKSVYPDYDAKEIESFGDKVSRGDISGKDLKEFAYLGLKARTLIDQAYQLGVEDSRKGIQEKANFASPFSAPIRTSENETGLTRQEGERSSNLFARVYQKNKERMSR